MNSIIKIIIRNPIGFPRKIPLTSFIIPKIKMEIIKYRVIFEMVSLNNFRAKTEL